jgi:hypothetical protein
MPYLHWETSGEGFNRRNDIIKELTSKSRDRSSMERSPTMIEDQTSSIELKILRAFLIPKNDCCLHIRRTLDHYSSNVFTEGGSRRIEDQVVYKFAKKQHNMRIEEAADRRQRRSHECQHRNVSRSRQLPEAERNVEREDSLEIQEEMRSGPGPSWDPPKILMVDQLWLWIIDGGRSCLILLLSLIYKPRTDTVITSFPAKRKSELSMDDSVDGKDIMEGDWLYDSTDIGGQFKENYDGKPLTAKGLQNRPSI